MADISNSVSKEAYLEECRTRRRRLSRHRTRASAGAGLLTLGALGLDLARRMGYEDFTTNEVKVMLLVPTVGLLSSVVPVEQGKGWSAVGFLGLYMAWIAGLLRQEWKSPKLMLAMGSVSVARLAWEIWTDDHGSE